MRQRNCCILAGDYGLLTGLRFAEIVAPARLRFLRHALPFTVIQVLQIMQTAEQLRVSGTKRNVLQVGAHALALSAGCQCLCSQLRFMFLSCSDTVQQHTADKGGGALFRNTQVGSGQGAGRERKALHGAKIGTALTNDPMLLGGSSLKACATAEAGRIWELLNCV